MSGSEWDSLLAMVNGGFGKRKPAAAPTPSAPAVPERAPAPAAAARAEPPRAAPARDAAPGNGHRAPAEDAEDGAEPEDDSDGDVVGPLPPGGAAGGNGRAPGPADDSDDDASDGDYADDVDALSVLPVAEQAVLRAHTRAVVAAALDPAGNRLLTGSADYTVRFWDFAGMDAGLRSFKGIEPVEGCPVRDLSWSPSGDSFLAATTSAVPKLFDREGEMLVEYAKGDMYLADMRNTKGHVAPLATARFHPFDPALFVTAGADSTVRIWDAERKRSQKEVIVFRSKARGAGAGGPAGLRTQVTAACFSPDGKLVAGAAVDGTLRVFPSGGPFVNPAHLVEGAHMLGAEVGGLVWSADGRTLLTRATDDTVKLWDLRSMKAPLLKRGELPAAAPEHNAVFSPDERTVLLGTAARKEGAGKLVFLRREDFSVAGEVEAVPEGSAVRVLWSAKINQIVVGCSDAAVRVRYDPVYSMKGVKQALGKAAKKRAVDEVEYDGPIFTPTGDKINEEAMLLKKPRKVDKAYSASRVARRPDAPITGQGKGGNVGTSLSEALYRTVVPKNPRAFEDAREAFLKHAEAAEKEPLFLAKAYEKTQPNPVFDERALEDEMLQGKVVKRRGMILKPSDIDKANGK
ncbi:WD40 repeat-like protein [Hyaloraphidium curvatum]|nr:WD40 repeat-like protein [Hyaloraphidium curvatum]